MSLSNDRTDEDLALEDIERRTEPRGLFPGMTATVLEGAYRGRVYAVDEASQRAIFLRADTPDSIPLGTRFTVEVQHRGRSFRCDLIVVRKEIAPRRGVAGLIGALSDASTRSLTEILAKAMAGPD
jgi:hypothetical protein